MENIRKIFERTSNLKNLAEDWVEDSDEYKGADASSLQDKLSKGIPQIADEVSDHAYLT